jgi:hypothetical protein
VFGAAALAFGLITLAWHDYNGWHLPRYIVYPAAAAEIFGGAAIQFRRTAKTGAVVLGAVYLVFALRCVPQIFANPRIYNSWGNFFEQFSLVTGTAIVYARLSSPWSRETPNRIGRIFWASVPLPLPSNRRFILTLPPILFRSGFRQLRCLGGNDDCSARTGGCGSSYESNGASHDSPSDNDARDLWATRVGTVDSFGSPQSYELERNRRDLRDCRSSVDSR